MANAGEVSPKHTLKGANFYRIIDQFIDQVSLGVESSLPKDAMITRREMCLCEQPPALRFSSLRLRPGFLVAAPQTGVDVQPPAVGGTFKDDPKGLQLKHNRKARARARKRHCAESRLRAPARAPPGAGVRGAAATATGSVPARAALLQGLLSVANAGHDTNTGHFSIMMGPAPHLNGGYVIFGEMVTGFEVRARQQCCHPSW